MEKSDFYRETIQQALFGYAYFEILFDNSGEPYDYLFKDVNRSFEKLIGVEGDKLVNYTFNEAIKEEEEEVRFKEHLGKFAKDGVDVSIEYYSKELYKWYKVQLSSINSGFITAIFFEITDLKNTDKELQRSNRKNKEISTLMRLMADNMPDMIWAKNLNKEYIFTNRSICNNLLSALDPLEPIGKSDMFFATRERDAHPDNPNWHTFGEICRDSDAITIEQMRPMQFEEFGNVKSKFLFLDVHKAPLLDEDGELIGVVGSARDVTLAKETENQLRKLSQAVEQSPVSVVITNQDGSIEYVNPKFTSITGYTLEDVIGHNPRVLKSETHSPEYYKELWQAITSGNEWHGEFHNRKKNGELFWEAASISPIINSDGKITHYVAVKEDVTNRKILESDLLCNSLFRELLMEISSDFINIPLEKVDETISKALEKMALFVNTDRAYTFDYDWDNEVCNNSYEWCAIGVNPEIENLQNLPLSVLKEWVDAHKKGQYMYIPNVFELPEGIGRETLEMQGIKSFLTVPMMNEERCIGFVGFDSVYEHRIYTSTEIQLLKIFAQMLVNIKLRKEMVRDLVLAKEKAEESNRLKTHFINNISHEIRTPLNGLLGFSSLMMQESVSESEKKVQYNILQQSGSRLIKTIDDIMDIAQLKAGSIKPKIDNIDIGSIMNNLAEKLQIDCTNTNILVDLDIDDQNSGLLIKTDEYLFTNILSQLISNAKKFTVSGRIVLGYSVKDKWFEFFVKDTGDGISPELLEVVFEPFMQENSSNTRRYEGSGLGLAIAKGMTELLGGKIWVESKKWEGSTFFFTLPLATESITKIEKKNKSKDDSKPGKLVVLIVEDDESNYQLLDTFVKKAGFSTLHAWNGVEAVNLCSLFPEISMIFMDIKMPVMNGVEATSKIKAIRPNTPIIAITAYDHTVDKHIMLEAGCDACLSKPIDFRELRNLIQQKLST